MQSHLTEGSQLRAIHTAVHSVFIAHIINLAVYWSTVYGLGNLEPGACSCRYGAFDRCRLCDSRRGSGIGTLAGVARSTGAKQVIWRRHTFVLDSWLVSLRACFSRVRRWVIQVIWIR